MEIREKHYGWWLLAFCILFLFLFMGLTPFHTRGEPREAVVAMSMLHSGNWILALNNGTEMAFKPPFFHWLVAAFSALAGGVSEYTSRLPSAVALTVMTLAGYRFYARRRGAAPAMLAALLTLTTFEVHRAGVNCRVDMVLAAMMVLSLYALYVWGERGRRGVPWVAVLCLSAAFLTKGPVGAALPCVVVWVFWWLRGQGALRPLVQLAGVGLASCVLPLLWYVAAWRQGGDAFLALVMEENVYRLLGKMTYASHENPAWYNVVTIVAGFVPYTLLAVFSLFALRPAKPSWQPGWWQRLRRRVREADPVRLFTLVSFVVIFVFYCIPKSKRSVYLLPVYPFLGYFLAEYVMWLWRRHRAAVKAFGGVMGALGVLLVLTYAAMLAGLVPDALFAGRHGAENAAYVQALATEPLTWWAAVLVALPAVGAVLLWRALGRGAGGRTVVGLTIGIVAAVYMGLDGFYQPAVLRVKSDRAVARRIEALVPEGRLFSYRTDQVKGNRMHPFTINFYLGDRVVPFDAFRPAEGWLIAGNDDIDTFLRTHAGYTAELAYDSGHKSCDDRKVVRLYRFRRTAAPGPATPAAHGQPASRAHAAPAVAPSVGIS